MEKRIRNRSTQESFIIWERHQVIALLSLKTETERRVYFWESWFNTIRKSNYENFGSNFIYFWLQLFEEEWENLSLNFRPEVAVSTNLKFKISDPAVWKPLNILLLLFLLQQLTGSYIAVLYAKKFFATISPRLGNQLADQAFIMFGVVRFLTSVAGTSLSFKFGRKPLLISSALGMLCTGLMLTLKTALDQNADAHGISNVRECVGIAAFLLYVSFASYGVMSIPWTLIVELLPTEARSIGSGIIISYGYGLMFVLGKVFPFATNFINPWHLFAIFSATSALLSLFVHKCVPETLGKNFNDIENYFKKV